MNANPMLTPIDIELVSLQDILLELDDSYQSDVQELAEAMLRLPGTEGLVLFRNLDASHERFGMVDLIPVGPGHPVKSIAACVGRHVDHPGRDRRYATKAFRQVQTVLQQTDASALIRQIDAHR